MVSLALASCGGEPTSTKPPPSHPKGQRSKPRLAAATPEARPARRATLRFEIRGRPFPLPLVSGMIGGQPALMLVDTGANSHVLAGWLARRLALPMKKLGDIGTDHVGKSIATYRVDKVDMAIDEWGKLGTSTVLATEVPDVIERLGIGAFISPQRLDEEGDAVVLDLRKGELRSAWSEDAREELGESGSPLVVLDQSHACEEIEGPVRGLAFTVPALIDAQRVQLLVDTGAQHSDVFTTSAAGQRLAPQSTTNKEPMYTASGKISARQLKAAKITVGAFSTIADVDLIQGAADASCARDGVLAMDVLRSCTLLLGRSKLQGRCSSR